MYSSHYKGTQDLSTYIPSADVLAKIDSAGFVPEAFVSQSSNIVSLDELVFSRWGTYAQRLQIWLYRYVTCINVSFSDLITNLVECRTGIKERNIPARNITTLSQVLSLIFVSCPMSDFVNSQKI